ncbi:MAG: hypothetical protein O2856_12515, partial [Planctomycetota bacterium]|nr:hypothetical protein [Planctomycetota bacterium]
NTAGLCRDHRRDRSLILFYFRLKVVAEFVRIPASIKRPPNSYSSGYCLLYEIADPEICDLTF